MPQLGFRERKHPRSGFRARDGSPDSVIFTEESNFSLFSSASASVDRCSFASDVHDHQSFVSEHLAGFDLHHCSSGPSPNRSTLQKNSPRTRRGEKTTDEDVQEIEIEYENQALEDCQNQRFRSEAFPAKKKLADRRRPVSLDLNNPGSNASRSSPRFGVMKKNYVCSRRSGTFPSPGTPDYRETSIGIHKGWSSERVPLPANSNRRLVTDALLPFSNGRALPSKWEHAEKWISSPVLGDGVSRASIQSPQRRAKSKSGPLGPPGNAYCSTYSPAMPLFDGRGVRNLTIGSPFSTGVMVADGLALRCVGGGSVRVSSCPAAHTEPCIARSASMHGYLDLLNESSLPSSQDEELDGTKDAVTTTSHVVLRKDMASQMSPEDSIHSSPKGRPFFAPSSPPSLLPIVEQQGYHSSKLEVRDVEVDERVTLTSWSKKHRARVPEKGSRNTEDWKKKAVEGRTSAWLKREEARITAWENLQKAKADAAIRKLEMKLERKRLSSMDKIMNKLRSAQRKGQEMRSLVSVNQTHQVAKTRKAFSFHKAVQMGSLGRCFTCHAL